MFIPAKLRIACALVVATQALAGCATVSIDLPSDFLVLERDAEARELRAATADEARVWVREHDAPPGAELPFWRKALMRDLVDARGYTVLEERDVKDATGREGVELLCEATLGGVPHRYLLAVFVLPTAFPTFFDDTIRTVEYAAEKDVFETHLAAVRAGIKAMR